MPYIGNQPYQGVIDSGNILNGSIDTVDLKDGSVTSAKLETIGGLTAGSYTTANITVDSKGRVTLASNGSGGVSSITGTADQITASASTGAITLSLPQSINTTSSPSFANITLTGEIRGPSTLIIDPTTVGDDTGIVRIRGDLQVDGTTTTINSTTLEVADLNITLAKNAANAAAADSAGITVAGASATLTYAAATDTWNVNKNILITPGTGNGILYLNANKVATTGSVLTFNGTTTLSMSSSLNGASNYIRVINFSNTANSGALLSIQTGGTSGGTAAIEYYNQTTAIYAGATTSYANYFVGTNPDGTTPYFAANSTGFGIGTTTPTFSTVDGYAQRGIHIAGTKDNGTAPVIRLSETGSGRGNWEIRSNRYGLTSGNLFQIAEATGGAFLTIRGDDDAGSTGTTGYVGIGTDSPTQKLEVSFHDTTTNRTNPVNVAVITATSASAGGAPYTGFGPALVFRSQTYNGTVYNGPRIRMAIGDDSISTTAGTSLAFDVTATKGASPTQAAIIDPSGNVGIGMSPSYKLDVTGRVRVTGSQSPPSTTDILPSSIAMFTGGGGDYLTIGQYTNSHFWIQGGYLNPSLAKYDISLQPLGGKVGIGTNNPSERLQVNGSIYITEASGNYLKFSADGYKYITSTPSTGDYLAIANNPYASGIQFGVSTVNAPATFVPKWTITTAGDLKNTRGAGFSNTSFAYSTTVTPTSTSGGTAIYNIYLPDYVTTTEGMDFELIVHSNPNGGGSGAYRQVRRIHVHCTTGWHGTGYTPILEWDAISDYMSLAFNVVIYYNGNEFTSLIDSTSANNGSLFWNTSGVYLRVKVWGFNTTYPGHQDLALILGHRS